MEVDELSGAVTGLVLREPGSTELILHVPDAPVLCFPTAQSRAVLDGVPAGALVVVGGVAEKTAQGVCFEVERAKGEHVRRDLRLAPGVSFWEWTAIAELAQNELVLNYHPSLEFSNGERIWGKRQRLVLGRDVIWDLSHRSPVRIGDRFCWWLEVLTPESLRQLGHSGPLWGATLIVDEDLHARLNAFVQGMQ